MSSTNKTGNFKLNQWIASDKPQRTDFNYDNSVIDTVLANHFNNTENHISKEERELWNTNTKTGLYFGDGQLTRNIETECTFEPSCAFVFALNKPTSLMSFDEMAKYNYSGFCTQLGGSLGISMENDGAYLAVSQDRIPSIEDEYACLNQSGTAYAFILFK